MIKKIKSNKGYGVISYTLIFVAIMMICVIVIAITKKMVEERKNVEEKAVFRSNVDAVCTFKEYIPPTTNMVAVPSGKGVSVIPVSVPEKFIVNISYFDNEELKEVQLNNRVVYEMAEIGEPVIVSTYEMAEGEILVKEKNYKD